MRHTGDVDRLYEYLTRNDAAAVLKRIDEVMFENTPLHIAAEAGKTRFTMEVMNLMPSFTRKLNRNGRSPFHLAMSEGHSDQLVYLLHADREPVR